MASMLSRGVVLAENLVKNAATTRVSLIYLFISTSKNLVLFSNLYAFVRKILKSYLV